MHIILWSVISDFELRFLNFFSKFASFRNFAAICDPWSATNICILIKRDFLPRLICDSTTNLILMNFANLSKFYSIFVVYSVIFSLLKSIFRLKTNSKFAANKLSFRLIKKKYVDTYLFKITDHGSRITDHRIISIEA